MQCPNVLIPMAGAGKRFKDAGYALPKPLIDIHGKPMIQRVVESLNINGRYIFLAQKEHITDYDLSAVISGFCKDFIIIPVDGITEGAACTTLLAEEFINTDRELIIANSDQFLQWNSASFLEHARDADGCIVTFWADHPKWSYVTTNKRRVTEVAEKVVISNEATVGVYYWKRGWEYVEAAKSMILKNIRTNNEFYVCPVYNEVVKDLYIISYEISGLCMHGLGTPEDLEKFNESVHNSLSRKV